MRASRPLRRAVAAAALIAAMSAAAAPAARAAGEVTVRNERGETFTMHVAGTASGSDVAVAPNRRRALALSGDTARITFAGEDGYWSTPLRLVRGADGAWVARGQHGCGRTSRVLNGYEDSGWWVTISCDPATTATRLVVDIP